MKVIEIFGLGCAKCNQLFERAETAAQELGITYKIEKITDINRITDMGVMLSPALVVDGIVKAEGKIPSKEAIKGFLGEKHT